ncbi:MAG: hypothetical protein AAF349_21870 [Cyanobacteria bacterium P01_A01_bin.68]
MEINSERIDDIPVIVEWLKQMEIAKIIDQKLKKPHGNYLNGDDHQKILRLKK